jgi:hypothetical protein
MASTGSRAAARESADRLWRGGAFAPGRESCVMFALPDGWSLVFWLILSFGCAALIAIALVGLSIHAVCAMFPNDPSPSEHWPYDGE